MHINFEKIVYNKWNNASVRLNETMRIKNTSVNTVKLLQIKLRTNSLNLLALYTIAKFYKPAYDTQIERNEIIPKEQYLN